MHFRRVFSVFSESFIYQPIREMARRGANVRVLTVARYREGNERLPTMSVFKAPPRIQGDSTTRQVLGWLFRMSQPDMILWPAIRLVLKRHVTSFQPDLLHAHFGPESCLLAPVARALGIPLVVTFYGYDVSRLLKSPKSAWPRRYQTVFEHATAAIAISNHVAGKLRDVGIPDDRIHVIRLGIRVDEFTPKHHERDSDNIVQCLHIGRLTPKKGPLQLIRAVHQARQRLEGHIDLRLIMAGDGELRRLCEREIDRLGASHYIELRGAVPHVEIPSLLQQADIYTQHSMTAPDGDMEGLGVTFMEAQASGLPVVSTFHNGIPEIVTHEQTGLLAPEGDVDVTADHIVRLAESVELRAAMGRCGRARAEANFTLDQAVDAMLDLYGFPNLTRRPRPVIKSPAEEIVSSEIT